MQVCMVEEPYEAPDGQLNLDPDTSIPGNT